MCPFLHLLCFTFLLLLLLLLRSKSSFCGCYSHYYWRNYFVLPLGCESTPSLLITRLNDYKSNSQTHTALNPADESWWRQNERKISEERPFFWLHLTAGSFVRSPSSSDITHQQHPLPQRSFHSPVKDLLTAAALQSHWREGKDSNLVIRRLLSFAHLQLNVLLPSLRKIWFVCWFPGTGESLFPTRMLEHWAEKSAIENIATSCEQTADWSVDSVTDWPTDCR